MLVSGSVIDQRYELIRRLDRGSMGEVWLAHESQTRHVAIKFILPDKQEPGLVERFLAEVRVIARLRSSHVVGVHHWGSHAGSPYMVMELLEGTNLAERLRSQGKIEDIRQAVDYAVQACEALVVAHGQGVIHRDLKPANLFLDRHTRQIKVLDFGIAKATESLQKQGTTAGSYFGTLAYSSPEQVVSATDVTPRSDLWSIGATLYELLSGVPAFPEPYPQILNAIHSAEPRSIRELRPDLPARLAEVVMRCLRKDPRERFVDARDLIVQLAKFGSSESDAIAARLVQAEPPPIDRGATNESSANANPMPQFHSEDDLVEAVCAPRRAPDGRLRRVIFMLGAGFSMPTGKRRGVPGTRDIVARIQKQLSPHQVRHLRSRLEVSTNEYQDAFDLLASVQSADAANAVIRHAVLEAYGGKSRLPAAALEQERKCTEYEHRADQWQMPEGISHLGKIIARGLQSERSGSGESSPYASFSGLHLTTNFDPLLAVSTRREGGACWAYPVDKDYDIPEPGSGNCLIVHLHGRWDRGDTLHNDLSLPREQLQRSLGAHLERSVLVVLGYGGWDDVFTRTLKQVTRGRNTLDVLWGFFSNDPRQIAKDDERLLTLLRRLGPRVQFYRGVDTNRFFQRLAARLAELDERPHGTERPVVGDRPAGHPSKVRTGHIVALVGASLAVAGAARLWPAGTAPVTTQAVASQSAIAATPAVLGEPPADERPALRVVCDPPLLRASAVRLGAVAIPIDQFCPKSEAGSSEHAAELLRRYPALAAAERAVLEPPHPFYSVRRDLAARSAEWRIERAERARVVLSLHGGTCSKIKLVTVLAGTERTAASIPAPPRAPYPGIEGAKKSPAVCDASLDLPFEVFGKALQLVLTPAMYVAPDVSFESAYLETSVALMASDPLPPPQRALAEPATPEPVPAPRQRMRVEPPIRAALPVEPRQPKSSTPPRRASEPPIRSTLLTGAPDHRQPEEP